MGIRETLNENPRIAAGAIGGVIVLVLAFAFWPSGGSVATGNGVSGQKVYFSDDDGKNFFADEATKVPPYDHGGKQAVRVHVYSIGGKKTVHHLERYTPEVKQKLEDLNRNNKRLNDPTILESGLEVKKPGDAKWLRAGDLAAQPIIQPPAGGGEEIYP